MRTSAWMPSSRKIHAATMRNIPRRPTSPGANNDEGRLTPALMRAAIDVSGTDLRLLGQVLAVPLHREIGQRSVVVHLLDDRADLVEEGYGVERRALVERDRERLGENRVTDDPDRPTLVDRT